MPVLKNHAVFEIVRNVSAFLNLEVGVTRGELPEPGSQSTVPGTIGVPGSSELQTRELQRVSEQLAKVQLENANLRDYARRLGQNSDTEKRLASALQQEKERRERAESRLGQRQDGADAPAVMEQTHGLPEPDESVSRRQIFRSLVSPLKPGKMLDLGAGPGHYSLEAARLGWKVTAVDARTARTPNPEVEKNPKRAELIRSVKWVEADVREYPINGEYDLICIFGLLHHLEVNDHIKLLSRCSNTLTFLNVRIAPGITATEGPYEGEYSKEPGETREERDRIPAVSWGNEVSFLHTEESLLRLVQDCGYSKMMPMRPPHSLNYTFYLCLPSPG